MRVTKPLALTLVSTNVAESSLDEWSVATAYTVGNQVFYDPDDSLTYHEFEALTNQTGAVPAIGGTTDWLDLGPANARAMFDDRVGSQTLVDEELVVAVTPGAFFDTIALLNISACSTINVLIKNGETTLYDEDFDTSGHAEDWASYFFGEDEDNLAALSVYPGIFAEGTIGRSSLILNPEIFYASCTITITMTGSAGTNVGLGLLALPVPMLAWACWSLGAVATWVRPSMPRQSASRITPPKRPTPSAIPTWWSGPMPISSPPNSSSVPSKWIMFAASWPNTVLRLSCTISITRGHPMKACWCSAFMKNSTSA